MQLIGPVWRLLGLKDLSKTMTLSETEISWLVRDWVDWEDAVVFDF